MDPKAFDMNSIFSVAKQIAEDIKNKNPDLNKNTDTNEVDMSKIIQQVTNSVSHVVTPDFLANMGANSQGNKQPAVHGNHHKKHKKSIANSQVKTPDINFEMPVSLYDIYHGKNKKMNVKVKRINKDENGELKLVTEKIKLQVEIEKGINDNHVVCFEGKGDQKPGFKPGDINITIHTEEDELFERDGDNLIYHHFCSLGECYELNFKLDHVNGYTYLVTSKTKTFNFQNPVKIIKGLGMPCQENSDEYGDLIIILHFALPYDFDEDKLEMLKTLFPSLEQNTIDPETEFDDTLEAEDADDAEAAADDDEDPDDEDYDDEELESDSKLEEIEETSEKTE